MRSTTRWSIFLPALLLPLGQGCPPPDPGTDVRLTQADTGRTVQIPVGARIVLSLEANYTTGYEWRITQLDTAILPNTANDFKLSSDLVGAGGTETWEFTGQAPGTTALRLEYRRWWEPLDTPATAFELTVTVTPAGS